MSLKFTAIISLMRKFPERVGSQGVQFSVAIILARLLSPADSGMNVMISGFGVGLSWGGTVLKF